MYAANTHLAYKLQMNIHRWHKIPKQMVCPNLDVDEMTQCIAGKVLQICEAVHGIYLQITFRLMPLPNA